MAVSLAIGFLFLGGGTHTFSTSNGAIAALLITLYPRLPTGPNDNRCHLQELVLRDNKLTKIPDASIFQGLLVFDVSFNEISSLNGLSKVSSTLKELYVSKNEVAKME